MVAPLGQCPTASAVYLVFEVPPESVSKRRRMESQKTEAKEFSILYDFNLTALKSKELQLANITAPKGKQMQNENVGHVHFDVERIISRHAEVHCIFEDDSHRRADIIAINRQQQKAIIIDPTIRMERDLNQAHQNNCKGKGKGVILYKEFTPANKWIRQPDRLASSEWRQALKMTSNVFPLRAIPGRSRDGNNCRRCVSEIETLGHVLGACPFSETLRNSRHHRIRSMIAEALRKKGLTVHEEVHGISQEGSCRRIDMLAIPSGSTSAYIIDPTVRFEAQEQQPTDVHAEKCRIYEPTVPFYLEKYHLTSIEVVGLMVGARGHNTSPLCQFLQEVPAEQRLHS
ncbi:hypothetical protein ANN_21040 [Periplaneta americana]|uniref:Reverse transcriptase n=1 Tax=Periplaneta americana TaxID=6978 RepID=A0ABQ8SF50_PERAM|nr:hypothetical protein ANN_21040 [Periplaneta americana]